jgi:hypothetical protein
MEAMRSHLQRPDVQVNALAYLLNLVVEGPEYRPLVLAHPSMLSTCVVDSVNSMAATGEKKHIRMKLSHILVSQNFSGATGTRQ